jgi:hypothetical protein
MTSFATPPELEAHLQRGLDLSSALAALEGASAQLRGFARWSVSAQSGVILTLDGNGSRWLVLPTRHLTAVTSVVEEGITLVVDDDYDWTARGRLIRVDARWSCKPRSVVVTFDHGYPADSPQMDQIKQLCLNLAAKIYDNPDGARQYSVGGVSESFAGAAEDVGALLGKQEQTILTSLRLLAVG